MLLLVYFLFYSSYFKIKDVRVEGCEVSMPEDISKSVARNGNILLSKNKVIEKNILSQFPEVKEVQIYKGLPDAIKVVILEYDKSVVWKTQDKFYLVSSQGTVYKDVTEHISDYATLPQVVDKKNIPVVARQKILSPNFIAFVSNVYKSFESYTNMQPDYFWVDETTVDIYLQTKNSIYIKFDSLRASKKQLENVKSVLVAKKSEVVEYVDVRIDGWAYIK